MNRLDEGLGHRVAVEGSVAEGVASLLQQVDQRRVSRERPRRVLDDVRFGQHELTVGGQSYDYFSLPAAAEHLGDISRLPFSLKVLLENLLRFEDGKTVTVADIEALGAWLEARRSDREIAYRPARVLMQDFTGVPAVVDLAAMRAAMTDLGGDPRRINPLSPVDLVIDHSVMVDHFGSAQSFQRNVDREYERNGERYTFLRWGQSAFDNFRVVPPGTGICHQVNLEYLAQTVWTAEQDGETVAYPDSLVGTDSHTTMVNGLAVLGWGVGGIEAEAAMLGQPISMLIPEVIGFRLTGKLLGYKLIRFNKYRTSPDISNDPNSRSLPQLPPEVNDRPQYAAIPHLGRKHGGGRDLSLFQRVRRFVSFR